MFASVAAADSFGGIVGALLAAAVGSFEGPMGALLSAAAGSLEGTMGEQWGEEAESDARQQLDPLRCRQRC